MYRRSSNRHQGKGRIINNVDDLNRGLWFPLDNGSTKNASSVPPLMAASFSSTSSNSSPERGQTPSPPRRPKQTRTRSKSNASRRTTGTGRNHSHSRAVKNTRGAQSDIKSSPSRREDRGIMRGAEILKQQLRVQQQGESTAEASSAAVPISGRIASPTRRKHRNSSTSRRRPNSPPAGSFKRSSNRASIDLRAFDPAPIVETANSIKKPSQKSKDNMNVLLDVQDLEDQMKSLRNHLHGHGNGEYSYLYGEDSGRTSSPTKQRSFDVPLEQDALRNSQCNASREGGDESNNFFDIENMAKDMIRVPIDPPAQYIRSVSKTRDISADNLEIRYEDVFHDTSNDDDDSDDYKQEPKEVEVKNSTSEESNHPIGTKLSIESLSEHAQYYDVQNVWETFPAAPMMYSRNEREKELVYNDSYCMNDDPAFEHAIMAGTVWQSLVGEQIRFPKKWYNGARTPPLLGDAANNPGSWSYIASVPVRSDRFLNKLCVKNRTKPGKILLHIIVRDGINWQPTRHIAIGVFHPNARGIRSGQRPNASDESLRTVWMAMRKCTGLFDEEDASYLADTATNLQRRIDRVLLHGMPFDDVATPSPLGDRHTVNNENVRAVFGDDPPLETVFMFEKELYQILQSAADEQGKINYKSRFSSTLTLLEQFVFKRRR